MDVIIEPEGFRYFAVSRKQYRIECRLGDRDYYLLKRFSDIEGLSMSAMLRWCFIEHVRKLTPQAR